MSRISYMTTLAALCWLTTIAAGMTWLIAYAGTPGTPATPPARWPAASTVARRAGEPTLLVFAHPSCPCTRATLAELDRVLAHTEGRADVHVLVLQPEPDRAWPDATLAELAAAIPTVHVRWDVAGVEAARFGIATSGQVLLYDTDGGLRFAGGITGARGHEGANPGADGLFVELTAPMHASRAHAASPVFGCELRDPPTT